MIKRVYKDQPLVISSRSASCLFKTFDKSILLRSRMKLFVVLCVVVTIAYVSAESDPQEPNNELTDPIKRILKREAVDDFMIGPSNDANAVSRERRAPQNPCNTNWFKRVMGLDNFACNVKCSGQRWRGGKCVNRNCVCH